MNAAILDELIHLYEENMDTLYAVSYTHLDVYKRQAVNRPKQLFTKNTALC